MSVDINAVWPRGNRREEGRLLRFPDIHQDKIAFMYGGDLWLASSAGGMARRITTHPGRELFPKFSPDGKWIAFTGEYDGNFNVYVMSAEGGQPRQLTFYQGAAQSLRERMGVHNQVVTWTPDSSRIVFLSVRDTTNGWTKRLFSVSLEGGIPEAFAHERRRPRNLLSRWHENRIQPDFPKFPHLEALYRWLGAEHHSL